MWGTHGTAGRGRDRAVEPSSPAQVPSPHLTAHPGHRPPPTGVLGWAVGGLKRPEAHAAAPQPALCRCLRAALACLNVPGGHELLAVLGGVRGGHSNKHPLSAHPGALRFGDHLGSQGRWWTLSFFPYRMQPQCTARGLAQDTRVCSSAVPHPSSTSLLPAGESQLPGTGQSQAQPHWAARSPGHPPTELSRLPPNSSSTSGNPNPTIHSHILKA